MSNTVLEGFRLSPQQEHLWLLQRNGDERDYRAECVIAVNGPLDPQVLEDALRRIIERHDIFRTSFQRLTGMTFPLQVVRDGGDAPQLPTYDLSSMGPSDQAAGVEALRREIGRQSFDLEEDLLLRLRLVKLAPDSHLLLVSLPALCMDAKGLGNFLSEVASSYADCLRGEESSEEPLRYADFSDWQHEILASEETEAGRHYWRQKQFSESGAFNLPLKKSAAGSGAYEPRVLSTTVEAGLLSEAEALARCQQVSLPVLLLGCFQLLLWRLTQQSEIVTGVAAGGRNYEELETAPGLFARFLPVHTSFAADSPSAELLREVERTMQEALEWQEFFNWERLKTYTPSGDNEGGVPYIPFGYEFVEEGESVVTAGGLTFALTRASANISRFDVLLRCLPQTGGRLLAEWHYDARLYAAADVGRLAEQWQAVLASVIRRADDRASEVNVLGAEERALLLSDFGQGLQVEPGTLCLHELFEAQAGRTPDAVAVVFEDERLSYRELNQRADRFSNYLRRRGVERESRVALLMERSTEMVVALLGVLKAGGAYVPLDAEYPAERLALMLEDVGPRVLVTQGRLKAEAAAILDAAKNGAATTQVICVDEQWAEIEEEGGEEAGGGAGPDNLAYVIYTSGSTGRPKGVMISHGAICNRLLWMQRTFPLAEADSVLQKTSFSFDASVWEFFAPLFAGACLFMAQPGGHRDSAYLVEEIARREITTLQLVPSMLRVLLDEPGLSECRSLRRVFCGGEALTYDLQEKFFARVNAELNNLYGPTETSIDATFRPCVPGDEERGVLIGRPISNIQVYLLDSRSEPAPVGVGAELHVGGVGLARGYLNRPALTAERFIPNPFSPAPGERLYRTGDLARFLPDGTIEYLGRTDHQVKLRGFRIELGEIEAVLCEQPGVRAAVVVVREDEPERQRLVAYVVTDRSTAKGDGAVVLTSQLLVALKGRLPDYMIPSAVVALEEFPRLPNGKVDRKSLPAPDRLHAGPQADHVGPRNQVEDTLARIWAEVLNLKHVGVRDNFFELGGDSILSIQVVTRANQAGLKFSPKQLFRHQTIAELADVVGLAPALEAPQGVLVGDVPLTPIQRHFFGLRPVNLHHFNQSVMLELKRPIEARHLQAAVERLVLHHDALRLRFVEGEHGAWRQFYEGAEAASGVRVRHVELGDIEDRREQEAALEAAAGEIQRSLNIERGPVLRAALIELGAGRGQRLLLVVHHLAVDGVSWRILLEDLEQGLEQASRGAEVELRAKTSSYQQWAERLEEYARRLEVKEEAPYWSNVARLAESVRLPLDYQDGEGTRDSTRLVRTSLKQEETRALLQEVPAAYHTQINDVLLTALVEAVGRWSGRRRLVVEMEGHGREEITDELDLSRTVGWFTNLYPVALDLEGAETLGASLMQVKEQLRSIPRGGIGYGVLRHLSEEPAVREQLKAGRRTEVSFNYLGQLDQVLDASSLFAGARERGGPQQSERGRHPYTIEVAAAVLRGELQVSWTYSEQLHARETIERVAADYVNALRELIEHCLSDDAGGFTPSDFPLVQLNQEALDSALGEIEFG
jgi:amino acid adenylation domain-containing protein/non-ribosomal peptide synthase protein (TIGR01720 family)